MITPSHSVRNPFGRRSNTSCAMASISASEGAFASVHIRTYLACVVPVRILVLRVDLGAPIGDRTGISGVGGRKMKQIVTVAIWAAFAGMLLPGTLAQAQTASLELRVAAAPKPAVTDLSAQRRR